MSIHYRRGIAAFLIFVFSAAVLFSANSHPSMDNIGLYHPLDDKLSFNPEDYGAGWIVGDENGDGMVDYGIFLDEDTGNKVYEVKDYNYDGYMDDFYFYDENGALMRRELDQNYDRKIDLWVYLTEGVYVEGYERDLDFDGRIDVVKLYGDQQ